MFDIGFGELLLIAVVALVVLGPERLPGAARTAGALLRKARQSWAGVRAEIEQEMAAEEFKRSIRRTLEEANPVPEVKAALNEAPAAPQASPPNEHTDERG